MTTRLTVYRNERERRWEARDAFGNVEFYADTRRECDAYASAENQRRRDNAPPSEPPRRGLGPIGLPF